MDFMMADNFREPAKVKDIGFNVSLVILLPNVSPINSKNR